VQLEYAYLFAKIGLGSFRACIDWAVERLQKDEEGSDLDIVLLAWAEDDQVIPLVERIISKYCPLHTLDEQFIAGKYVAELRKAYFQNKETIVSLDAKLWNLHNHLDSPTWLVMLCRNCEYAMDVPAFVKPFEEEFAYIAGLWESVTSRADFEARYSRAISNQHEAVLVPANPIRLYFYFLAQLFSKPFRNFRNSTKRK